MGHDHGHATAAQAHRGRLLAVLVLTLVVLVVEVVGGLVSGSFALLADAGHMLTDALGVGLALGATALAARPATAAPHLRVAARRDPRRAGRTGWSSPPSGSR